MASAVSWLASTRPTAAVSRPAPTITFEPTRSTILALSGAITTCTAAMGISRTPASKAVYPSTDCRNWVRRNSEPNMAKNVRAMAPEAALNRRSAKNAMSSMG